MQTRTLTDSGDVRIDGGPPIPGTLTIEQVYRLVTSASAVKPNPEWAVFDEAGHFHAWDMSSDRPSLPTLAAETIPVPCDGSCGGVCGGEGFTTIRYQCRICGADVEPGTLPAHTPVPIHERSTWTVRASTPPGPLPDGEVSVVVESRAGTKPGIWHCVFGVGRCVSWSTSCDGSEVEIAGVSPLGVRANPAVREKPGGSKARLNLVTRRLWHTSQHGKCPIWLAGRIQDDVEALRAELGLPEFGWNDAVPDEEVGRCSVHPENCIGQHTHNPPVPFRGRPGAKA